MLKRVVITGLGAISPLGNDVSALMLGLSNGQSCIKRMPGWEQYTGLKSLVAAPAQMINEKEIPRKQRRSMGRLSIFASQASKQALADAAVLDPELSTGRIGCVIGSTIGSAKSLNDTFEIMLPERDLTYLPATQFFQCVSNTAAINVAQYLGLTGMVLSTSAACASSLQAIGVGYDLIRLGKQELMICGGAEELHPTVTGTFDILYATSSHFNDTPDQTPRPFDKERDGLVCGEGSGILILEEYEHARDRGAHIYAEIIGYHTAASGVHVSQSSQEAMVACLNAALADASTHPDAIDYLSAHATATVHGDEEEAKAIREVFGDQVPVSSLKGYIGHTLGASGAIELIASLLMMEQGIIYPTLNLENIAPECDGIQHVTRPIKRDIQYLIKNCFAFGGINAALVCRKL